MKVKEITRKCSKTNYERGTLYRVSFTDIPDYAKNMWRENSAGTHMTLTEPILEMQAVITPNKKLMMSVLDISSTAMLNFDLRQ